jgi:HEAT repeat protein
LFALATAMVLLASTPGDADNTPLQTLLRDGQYQEAVAGTLQDGTVDPKRAAEVARNLLLVALGQEDPPARMFALRTAVRLGDPVFIEAAQPAARSPDRYEQALALDLLASTDPQRSRPELLHALESPYRAIRLRGLQGLAQLRDPTLVDRFDAVLTADPDPDLRLIAVRGLLSCGTPSVGPVLHRGLDDAVNAVREESVKALVQLGDQSVSAVIRRRILDDNSADRRAFALQLAGHIPDPTLLNDIVPFLADGSPEVRAAAAGAVLSITARPAPTRQ